MNFKVLSVNIPDDEVLTTYVTDLVAAACEVAMPETLDEHTFAVKPYR